MISGNGTITGFASAVQLGNSGAVAVERIHATANTFAGVIAGDMATVGNCKIIGNAVGRNQTGIFTSEGALVVNNVSRNNRSYGIAMDCPGAAIANTMDCPGAAIANTTSNNLGDNFHQVGGNCDPTLGDCCVVNEHNSTL